MDKNYCTQILSNGMTVKTLEINSVHSVTIALFIPISAAQVEKKNIGIYHFLEHMAFRRMDGWCQKEIYYHAEKIGSALYGTTYKDYIKYSMTVLPRYFSPAMEIFLKLLKAVCWNGEEIRAEKQVVINQIKFQNYYSFEKRVDKVYYKGTGCEHEIMGNQSSVKAFSKSYVNAMREKVFAVQNCCLVIAGNVEREKIRDEVLKMEQLLPSTHALSFPPYQPMRFLQRTHEDCLFLTPGYDSAEILLSFDVPESIPLSDVAFLSGIIGQGDGGLLSVALREDRGYTNEIFSCIQQVRGSAKLVIQCETAYEDVVNCIRGIFGVLDMVKREITEESYLSAKPFYTENREMLYDSTEKMADWLGYRFIYPDSFATIEQQIRYCETITVEKLKSCAGQLFTGNNLYAAVSCRNKDRVSVRQAVEEWRTCNSLPHAL